MNKIYGVGASKGYAIGKIKLYSKEKPTIEQKPITDAAAELERFEKARADAIAHLNEVGEKAKKDIGEEQALIFEIHAMMLNDLDYLDSVQGIIKGEKLCAEYAVWQTGQIFSQMFASMEDEYMKQRAADVIDISDALIGVLTGTGKDVISTLTEPVILAAEDLMPSETVQMDKSVISSFITCHGSKISHSAILARTLGIPAVVGLADSYGEIKDGMQVVVDGFEGVVYLEPDDETIEEFKAKRADYLFAQERLQRLKGKPSVTVDGICVDINVNIGHPSDVKLAIENDGEGIGLFRSEFLYMESDDYPSEEVQFEAYRTVVEGMKGKRVIVRTLDVGADKVVPYFKLPHEDNPAMGYRAIRICLDRPQIFETQLRALLRASAYGRLAVMVPMITSVAEVVKTKELIEKIKLDLRAEGIPFDDKMELGIMIETPAAVMISDLLAEHVDFFSIGTNDLTQYTLAVDRMNHEIGEMYNPRHTAVLRMMRTTVENGLKHNVWTGVCGESAADLELVPVFLAMGIKELSVTPTAVLEVREKVRETNVSANKEHILRGI